MNSKTKYHVRKNAALEKFGNKCCICDSTKNLTFNHIDQNSKEYIVSTLFACAKEEILQKELSKCQLLCKECYLEKKFKGRDRFQHGTKTGWRKSKCECELCLSAKRKFYEQRNETRRVKEEFRIRGPYLKDPPHGTSAKYYRGCKCDDCRTAKTKQERERRQKRVK